jgi:hypothetical protein
MHRDVLSIDAAASLLHLDRSKLQFELLQGPALADAEDKQEAMEFTHTYVSN